MLSFLVFKIMGSVVKPKFRKQQRVAKAKPLMYSRQSRRMGASIGPELKNFDTAVSFAVDQTLEVPATGQWALVPQGDSATTRDGRRIVVKSIQFRGDINGNTGGAGNSSPALVQIWVVQDTQANGAAAAATDVFDGTGATSCLRNLNNSKRFRILHTEKLHPHANGSGMSIADIPAAATGIWRAPFEFFLKTYIPMTFSGTAGAITEITENNVFIVAGAVGNDDLWGVNGNARIRFVG